jgi:hypothetical protein
VTQQYMIGELSSLLGELQPPEGEGLAGAVHALRREVECSGIGMLPTLAHEALRLTDMICWAALERGDSSVFIRCAHVASALAEFGDSAGLLPA